MPDIETAVRKFVTDNFLYREGVTELSATESLLETGLIDSTGILELVHFLEKAFDIRVADSEILPDNLDSIAKIIFYVRHKLSAKPEVTHAS